MLRYFLFLPFHFVLTDIKDMLENLSVDKKTQTSDDEECVKKDTIPVKDVLECKMMTKLKSSIWQHGKGNKITFFYCQKYHIMFEY